MLQPFQPFPSFAYFACYIQSFPVVYMFSSNVLNISDNSMLLLGIGNNTWTWSRQDEVHEKQQPWVVVKTGQHRHPLCFDSSYLWPVHANLKKKNSPSPCPPSLLLLLPSPCLGKEFYSKSLCISRSCAGLGGIKLKVFNHMNWDKKRPAMILLLVLKGN